MTSLPFHSTGAIHQARKAHFRMRYVGKEYGSGLMTKSNSNSTREKTPNTTQYLVHQHSHLHLVKNSITIVGFPSLCWYRGWGKQAIAVMKYN